MEKRATLALILHHHHIALFLSAALVGTGCSATRLPVNYAVVAGGHVGLGSESSPSADTVTHTIGGIAGHGDIAGTFDDGVTGRARVDAMIGGSTKWGPAGELSVLAEGGGVLFEKTHHLFGRAGIEGTIERDPVTGFFSLEVPTLTGGYQYHGDDSSNSSHIEIGPRASLDVASRAFAMHDTVDVVARPEVGGTLLVLSEGVEIDATYMHVFATTPEDMFRAQACLAFFVATCVETRQIVSAFGEGNAAIGRRAGYLGVTFGGGWITGLERSFRFLGG